MAATELQRAHLHPLTFALDPLEALSSLELALVPFHLDNDEPGHDAVVSQARQLWLDRRHRALGATQAGVPPRPPPPPRAAAPPRRAIPEALVPLVQAVRSFSSNQDPPACSSVGIKVLLIAPSIYKSGPFPNFKALRLEAQKLGVVEFIRGQNKGGGGDYMRLTSDLRPRPPPQLPLVLFTGLTRSRPQYQDASTSPTPTPPPLAPPRPPTRTADDFHSTSLDFDPSPDDLAALSTCDLLLLQYRDDIQLPPYEAIERVFWRRRATALERGEELLPVAAHGPRFGPRASTPQAACATSQPGSPSRLASRAPAPRPPLPALDEPLPPAVYDPLHVLEILYLPPDTVPTIPHLLALFPPHLLPLASILHASSPTPIASTSSAPSTSVVARSAFVAFDSHALATEAHAHLNALRVPSGIGGGGAWSPWAGGLSSGVRPGWQWGDVRPEAREGLWGEVCERRENEERREREAREADEAIKRRREEGAGADPRGGSPKRQRLDVVDKVVAPSDPVPPHLLDSLFPGVITWERSPKNLKAADMCDDAFIWRFHAVAWAERPNSSGLELLFTSAADRHRLSQWVKSEAKRYWKKNGVVVRHVGSDEAARSSWRFSDFSPAWRREHGVVLDPATVASAQVQVVGELGEGPNPPPGAPPHWRTGWFEFEYVLHGKKAPPRLPLGMRSSTSSLAGRLGYLAGDDVRTAAASSSDAASRRASRNDKTLGPPPPREGASSSAQGPSRAPASGPPGGATAPLVDVAPRDADADADFYLEPFSSYSPSIDSDPFASMLSPASPSSSTYDESLDTPLSSLFDEDDLATSASVFAAAKSFRITPALDDDGARVARVDAIALSDFVDEFDGIMDEAAQLFRTAVEQDEEYRQDDIEMGGEAPHDQVELPVAEPEQAVDQGLVDMGVEVVHEPASEMTSLEVSGPTAASTDAPVADCIDDTPQQVPASPSSAPTAGLAPAGSDQPSSPLEPTRPSAPELLPEPPRQALVAARADNSVASTSSSRPEPDDALSADRPHADSPSRSPSQLQRAEEDLLGRVVSSSPTRGAERDEPARSSAPLSPPRTVVAADTPTAEALNAVDASSSSSSLIGLDTSVASSSAAVAAAPDENSRPPLAARLSSTSLLADPPLACRLSPLPHPLPTTPPLAARLGLRPSPSTPPPPDRGSSPSSAPSLAAPSLSLAERLSPRAPGRVSRTSPRREVAALPAVLGEPV